MADYHDPETTEFKRNSKDESDEDIYYYVGEEDLSNEIGSVLEENELKNVFNCKLVLLRYNCKLIEPFLQFLLVFDYNMYQCLRFEITNKIFDDARDKTINEEFDYDEYLEGLIFKNLKENLKINDDDYKKYMKYLGFYKKDNDIYLFLLTDNLLELKLDIDTNWTTVDEVVCHNKVENKNIDENLITLLKDNKKFIYLKNRENDFIDIPIMCYNLNLQDSNMEKGSYERVYTKKGDNLIEPVSFDHPIYGERFIFTSFNDSNDKLEKFILFIGECYHIFNNKDLVLMPDKIERNYDENDNIFVSDKSNNSYYMINNISNFMKL